MTTTRSSTKYYYDLLYILTSKHIKVRYKNNILGYFWSILQPTSMALVFYFAFKVVMRFKMENYLIHLLSCLFAWQWFSNSVGAAPGIFLGNAALIKKVSFPRNIIVLSVVLQDMIHFLLALPVYIIFMLFYDMYPTWTWLWGVPLLAIIGLCMIYGISLFIATINLFFRDMANIVAILVMSLFYFTPIIYSAQMIPEKYQYLVPLNPVAPYFISCRNLLYYNSIDIEYLSISLAYALLFLAIGTFTYKKLSWKFAEVL